MRRQPRMGGIVYVVVRSYSGQGASDLFDLLGQREQDVKNLISGVPGFVSYAAFRSGDGGMTVTVRWAAPDQLGGAYGMNGPPLGNHDARRISAKKFEPKIGWH